MKYLPDGRPLNYRSAPPTGALKIEVDGRDIFMARTFVYRTAGLPLTELAAIASPGLVETAANIDKLEKMLPALRESVCNHLYAACRSFPPATAPGRELLALKRAAHNGRPARAGAVERVAPLLDAAAFGALRAWQDAEGALQRAVSQLGSVARDDLEASRKAMHRSAASTTFVRALQVANTDLERKIDLYVHGDAVPVHKHRLLDGALLGYFLRAITKTSPFSSFGFVSHGFVRASAESADPRHARVEAFESSVRLSAGLLWHVNRYVGALLAARGLARISLNTTSIRVGDRVHFLRARYRPLSRVGALAAVASHAMFSVPVSPVVEAAMRRLARGAGGRLSDVASDIASELCGDAGATSAELIRLVDIGLLRNDEACDTESYDDALACLRHGARRIDSTPILTFIDIASSIVVTLAQAGVRERRIALQQVAGAAHELSERIPEIQLEAASSTLLYEDCTLHRPAALFDPDANRRLLDQLARLQRLVPLFDRSAPLHAALTEYFKKRFGPGGLCRDLPRFAEEFDRECAGAYWSLGPMQAPRDFIDPAYRANEGVNVEAADRLGRLRDAISRQLQRLAARHRDREGIEVPPSALTALAGACPTELHAIHSGAFFVQRCGSGDHSSEWVLNKVFGGSTQMVTRFLHLWIASPKREGDPSPWHALRAYLRETTPRGAVFAELPGIGDSNLNFHPPMLDYVIAANGSQRALASRGVPLALEDMEMQHDVASDRLSIRWRGGKTVIPIYLGGLAATLMPSVQRLLLLFGPTSLPSMPTWESIDEGVAGAAGIRHFPRVSSDGLVLLRRTWRVDASAFPLPAKGENDGEFFMRMRRWKQGAALPDQIYVSAAGAGGTAHGRRRKPSFVDFNSLRCLMAMQKLLDARPPSLWVSEALPAPGDGGQEPAHLCEYIFDFTSHGCRS
jgi:hypothetical protein